MYDLVDINGCNLPKTLMITIGGKGMAVAFIANPFLWMDVLAQAGTDTVPATCDNVVAAAKAIREAGLMEHPTVMNMKTGWNVGESFNLVFPGRGGEFSKPGTSEPSVDSPACVAALNTRREMVECAHPDHLTQASNETQGLWEARQAAPGIMLGVARVADPG